MVEETKFIYFKIDESNILSILVERVENISYLDIAIGDIFVVSKFQDYFKEDNSDLLIDSVFYKSTGTCGLKGLIKAKKFIRYFIEGLEYGDKVILTASDVKRFDAYRKALPDFSPVKPTSLVYIKCLGRDCYNCDELCCKHNPMVENGYIKNWRYIFDDPELNFTEDCIEYLDILQDLIPIQIDTDFGMAGAKALWKFRILNSLLLDYNEEKMIKNAFTLGE